MEETMMILISILLFLVTIWVIGIRIIAIWLIFKKGIIKEALKNLIDKNKIEDKIVYLVLLLYGSSFLIILMFGGLSLLSIMFIVYRIILMT